ncbi:MAG: sterol desaturase family protein [Chitinophagaceae bacterium]|nr:sterol desaturase family protein [Chitinophagaceae bacterium]
MEYIKNYFTTIPSSHRAAILIGGLVFFWTWETIMPLFTNKQNRYKHSFINIFFTFTTVLINFMLASLILWTSDMVVAHKIGILYYVGEINIWVFTLSGLLLLDFIGAYVIHWMEHKVKWMWKFHMVHHSDTAVDTTTANRHHPVESIFRAVFTVLAVAISGSPMWLVMLYQSLSVVFSQFNHANIKLHSLLDRGISWIIVSPNMHKIHHHFMRPETDSNYGNIFSLWDRIFKTFHTAKVENIQYGLDVLKDGTDNNLKYQIILPLDTTIKTDYRDSKK